MSSNHHEDTILLKNTNSNTMEAHLSRNPSHGKKPRRSSSLHVEAIVNPTCLLSFLLLRQEIEKYIREMGHVSLMYHAGPIDLSKAPPLLQEHCFQISIVDLEAPDVTNLWEDSDIQTAQSSDYHHVNSLKPIMTAIYTDSIASRDISDIVVHTFVLSEEEAEMEDMDDYSDNHDLHENSTACETLPLPHSSLHSLWENIILPQSIKCHLLSYAQTSLLFSDLAVSPHIITWNRVILLHGPPGTGKTSLCRSLAHKLSIRMSDRFSSGGYLLEIHSHSLFSKWFSESGKLVHRLFRHVRDLIENEPDALFCLLVDEVESLATSRLGSCSTSNSRNGSSGGEPSDSIRAVNSLLTSIDHLKKYKNVLVLATTNLTGSVDIAFVDRADMKQYIGLPCLEARYEILKGCVKELIRVQLVHCDVTLEEYGNISPTFRNLKGLDTSCAATVTTTSALATVTTSRRLLRAAELSDGFSGRLLRKLPFQAHAFFVRSSDPVDVDMYLDALCDAIRKEKKSLELLV